MNKIIKKLFLILPILLVVLSLSGCDMKGKGQGKLQEFDSNDTERAQPTGEKLSRTDTFDWQTYRSDEYRFEIKLPQGFYLEGKNAKAMDGYFQLKGKEFIFLQKETVDYVEKFASENPGIPGPSEYQDAIRLRIRNKVAGDSYDEDFDNWIRKESDIYIQDTGKVPIAGKNANFVSWGSICDDYSIFLSSDDFIVEFNTCASNFVADQEPDYFSRTIETFRFL